ncbi:hypothetical protein BDV12DRAFT_210641 [Aspergillus spectabilis]
MSFKRAKVNLLDPTDPTAIRTLPELIEWNAKHNPDHLFCTQLLSQSTEATDNACHVTHSQLRQAILRCSRRLRSQIPGLHLPSVTDGGEIVKSGPVVLFIGSNIGLWVHLLALMAIGVPVAVLSARLSPTAVRNLLATINAKAVIVSPRLAGTIQEAIAQGRVTESNTNCQVYIQEKFQHDLSATELERDVDAAFDPRHFISESDKNVLILHSSGTTGLPKPIFHPHRYLLGFTQCHQLNEADDVEGAVLSALPLFHGFGLLAPCIALGSGKPFMLPPPNTIPTGPSIVQLVQSYGPRGLMAVPHILEEITASPTTEWVHTLKPLQFVLSGGGPLKVSVGEKLAESGVRLLAHFGTTECGPLAPVFIPTSDYDWRYIRLRRDIAYSLDVIQAEGSTGQREYKLTMRPFGWDEPFQVQDVLISRSDTYKYDVRAAGRTDDLIVLGNGEKVLPRVLEALLCEHDRVKAAVAFGEGQFQIGVLVEPVQAVDNIDEFKSILWPVITEAGKQMDSHARISSMSSIMITTPEKPLPRSDKGSVLRKEVYRIYASEIQRAYQDLESTSQGSGALNLEDLEDSLKDLILRELSWEIPDTEWDCDSDLFELGMNSLQATQLHRLLVSSLHEHKSSIPVNFIHLNPTIAKLTQGLRSIVGISSTTRENPALEIDNFIRCYSISTLEPMVVLLTGSTGNLGSNLLDYLVRSPHVQRVICLNRRASKPDAPQDSMLQRQLEMAKEKGVHIPASTPSKIEVLQVEPSADILGLDTETYDRLAASITHVIHNAWPMDFKRGLSSFRSQFQYLNSLLKLSLRAREHLKGKMRFLFISSIAVVGTYPSLHGTRIVPEVEAEKNSVIDNFGYGRAKFVCESMLHEAARSQPEGIELAIVRVGQMSGSSRSGHWNPKEHIPMMLRFSNKISKLPAISGTLSWIPVDEAATVLGEILVSPGPLAPIYHLENPIRQSWHDMMSAIGDAMHIPASDHPPFDEWLRQVREYVQTSGTEADRTEFQMLADFLDRDFRRMATGGIVLDTQNTRAASRTLQYADEVSPQVVALYVEQWR